MHTQSSILETVHAIENGLLGELRNRLRVSALRRAVRADGVEDESEAVLLQPVQARGFAHPEGGEALGGRFGREGVGDPAWTLKIG
jgi:hypothetical protein